MTTTEPTGEKTGARVRLLVLLNFALIPYVLARFPKEAPGYIRRCFIILWTGRGDLIPKPPAASPSASAGRERASNLKVSGE